MRITGLAILIFLSLTVAGQNVPIRMSECLRHAEILSNDHANGLHSDVKPLYFADYQQLINDSLQYRRQADKAFKIMPFVDAFYRQDINRLKPLSGLAGIGLLCDYSKKNFSIDYNTMLRYSDFPAFMTNNDYDRPIYINIGMESLIGKNFVFDHDFRINYAPYKFLRYEIAYSRLFIGDGYRSLLLSDHASAYPYFKIDASLLTLHYTCAWAVHRAFRKNVNPDIDENKFKNIPKFDVVHYLSWQMGRHLTVGFFETIITGNTNFYAFEYLNPVIFLRPVEFALGSENNAIIGMNLKCNINSINVLYAQFVIDDIIVGQLMNDIKHRLHRNYTGEYGWFANKWAMQLGYKTYNMFSINNLDAFIEFNMARPYIYSHSNVEQNYSHNGQPLAHPLGANFVEGIAGLSYRYKRLAVGLKCMYAQMGLDSTGTHCGQNIFLPTHDGGSPSDAYYVASYYNTILQGVRNSLITTDLAISYLINPKQNMYIRLGALLRYQIPQNQAPKSLNIIYLGLKTDFGKIETLY